MMPVAANFTHL